MAAETDLYVALHYAVESSVRACWDEAEFRRNVANRIGYDPFRGDASIDVRVRVGGAANAVDGHVEWRKANGLLMGERRFVAKDGNCAKLLTEMSFAVGLQIELLRPKAPTGTGPVSSAKGGGAASSPAPGAAAAATPPPSAPAPASAPLATPSRPLPPAAAPPPVAAPLPPKPDVADEPPDEPPPREEAAAAIKATAATPSSRWAMWIGGGPSLAWRISPSLTADGRLFLGIRRDHLSLEMGAEASYPSTERRWDDSGFRQTVIGGTLALCGHHASVFACLLGRASEMRVTGLGVDRARAPVGFVAQAGLRLATTLELGDTWFAVAHLDGLGLLTPCTVELNRAVVWEMPRLGGLVGIDLAARFW